MASWFSRRRAPALAPPLASRRRRGGAVRVGLADVAPEPSAYLGQLACLQLSAFETLSRIVAAADGLAAKEAVGRAASLAFERYRALVPEIERGGSEPAEAMAPFASAIERFRVATDAEGWREDLLRVHVTAGILDDFFLGLAVGLPGPERGRVERILETDSGQDAVSALLKAEVEHDPRIASRLALWGRRLVGDALLVAHSALQAATTLDAERMEPVFTELIAAHTRRMDAIGLTA